MSVINLMRKSLERMYIGTCDVIEHQTVTDPVTKRTAFVENTVLLAQPCRLSFKSNPSTGDGNTASLTQEIKLFISPDVEIAEGSKINVTQNGVTKSYANSGSPALYQTHQEITLTLFEKWA